MDIITAIKSGKRFRRNGHLIWITQLSNPFKKIFSLEDVLAEWEVEDEKIEITREKIEITREQFKKAVDSVLPHINENEFNHLVRENMQRVWNKLLEVIGKYSPEIAAQEINSILSKYGTLPELHEPWHDAMSKLLACIQKMDRQIEEYRNEVTRK